MVATCPTDILKFALAVALLVSVIVTVNVVIARTAVGVPLTVPLTGGPAREQAAEIVRGLVGAGISVYGLRRTHASLEDWFLTVTSRFGEDQ